MTAVTLQGELWDEAWGNIKEGVKTTVVNTAKKGIDNIFKSEKTPLTSMSREERQAYKLHRKMEFARRTGKKRVIRTLRPTAPEPAGGGAGLALLALPAIALLMGN